jgi:two-component system, chemotaxis family, chemotaxis protein CheY
MLKILIVDDSATVRMHVSRELVQVGFEVEQARDGIEGARMINDSKYDCVICDMNMPQMNGLEMVHLIKANPSHQTLPILMLTTEGSKALISQAQLAGAAGWVVKPNKTEQLVDAVRKLTSIAVST